MHEQNYVKKDLDHKLEMGRFKLCMSKIDRKKMSHRL